MLLIYSLIYMSEGTLEKINTQNRFNIELNLMIENKIFFLLLIISGFIIFKR